MSGTIGTVAAPLRNILNPATGVVGLITGIVDVTGVITPLASLPAGTPVSGLLDPVTGLLLPVVPSNAGVNGLLGPITGYVLHPAGGLIQPGTNLLNDPGSLLGTFTNLLTALGNPTTGQFALPAGRVLDAGANTLTDPATGLVRDLVTGELRDGTSGVRVVGDLVAIGGPSSLLVPSLSELRLSSSGTTVQNGSGIFPIGSGALGILIVERNAGTAADDPVTVQLESAALGLSGITIVRNAYLDLDGTASQSLPVRLEIGDKGILEISDTLGTHLILDINFTGTGGRLVVGEELGHGTTPGANFLSGIAGFDNDDVITFQGVDAATSARFQNNSVQLLNGGQVVASVGVSTDAFANGTALGFQSDGQGGFSVGVGLGNGGGLSSDVFTVGTRDEYQISITPQGSLFLQDTVGGRDGASAFLDATYVLFSNGVARFDASGVAQDVTRLYHAALDRGPEAAGLDFYVDRLDGGTSTMHEVAQNFTNSPEFLANYGQLGDPSFVRQLYLNVLDRAPSVIETNYYLAQLAGGATRGDVLLNFADSPEYIERNLGTAGDLDYGRAYRLYEAALNRTPEAGGVGFYVSRLQAGESLQEIARSFTTSPEFTGRYGALDSAKFVDLLYENVLGRDPIVTELKYYVDLLNQGVTRETVLIGFSESPENRLNTADATHDAWVWLGA
ncbi:DUF4214 domain-containing protein [Roseomonas sp. BN140053]|uniref:DUF4214 domain-containing protein n=1 Tax=Roseomonas sp. BN140053 TaxID=3391898 RepID=UPI0039E934EE